MTATAVRVQPGGGPAAGELTLQRAGPGDLEALSRFEPGNGALSGAQLAECIEYGGVLYYEDDHGPLALVCWRETARGWELSPDRKSTRLNSSHVAIAYAVSCLIKRNVGA